MIRALSLLTALTAPALLLALTAPATAQTITIGTAETYPPIIIHAPSNNAAGSVSGMEGQLIDAICARAGWTCVWQQMPFGELIPALEQGTIDIAAHALAYTPARALRVHMTCPYRPDLDGEITGTFLAISATTQPESGAIAVLNGSLHALALAQAGFTPQTFPDDASALASVVSGEISTYFGPTLGSAHGPARAALTPTGTLTLQSGGTSLGVTPTRPDLVAEVDDHLANLSRDGTITTISNRWLGQSVEDPIALCDIHLPIS